MADRNTIKSWFRRGYKPLEAQFCEWIDSFWHKTDAIPMASIDQLQTVLNAKQDKQINISPENVTVWLPSVAYQANQSTYRTYRNATSPDTSFHSEAIYRCCVDTSAGESPETNPEKWISQGVAIGSIAIESVVDLRGTIGVISQNIVANQPMVGRIQLTDFTMGVTFYTIKLPRALKTRDYLVLGALSIGDDPIINNSSCTWAIIKKYEDQFGLLVSPLHGYTPDVGSRPPCLYFDWAVWSFPLGVPVIAPPRPVDIPSIDVVFSSGSSWSGLGGPGYGMDLIGNATPRDKMYYYGCEYAYQQSLQFFGTSSVINRPLDADSRFMFPKLSLFAGTVIIDTGCYMGDGANPPGIYSQYYGYNTNISHSPAYTGSLSKYQVDEFERAYCDAMQVYGITTISKIIVAKNGFPYTWSLIFGRETDLPLLAPPQPSDGTLYSNNIIPDMGWLNYYEEKPSRRIYSAFYRMWFDAPQFYRQSHLQ